MVLPSTKVGTFPVGENDRNADQLPPGTNRSNRSSNGMFSVRINTHGRSDHEE